MTDNSTGQAVPDEGAALPRLLFDEYGATGLGRHRVTDQEGTVVIPPIRWRDFLSPRARREMRAELARLADNRQRAEVEHRNEAMP